MFHPLYNLAAWLAQPLVRRKLRRRGVLEPAYLDRVPERFGHYAVPRPEPAPGEPLVWIHAVSLGETRAAALLVEALRRQRPQLRLLLTHGTATGRAQGIALLRPGDEQVWQPWDTRGAVRRFLRHFRPDVGVLMETEVWPNLVRQSAALGVPLALANARLSEKSLRGANRLGAVMHRTYAALATVWAQTEADAERLRQAGARQVQVLGNLKFDARPDVALLARGQAWRARASAPVVLLASSREGEEVEFLKQVLAVLQAWGAHPPAPVDGVARRPPQWLIVPRHPQRFDEVARLVRASGLRLGRRSQWDAAGPAPDAAPVEVWLGDSLGEMPAYYALADVALLGGSFEPLGGQNLIEAAACGCPVVMGPHTFNFSQAAELAEAAGAAQRVTDLAAGIDVARALLTEPAELAAMRQAALDFAAAHRGAAERTAQALLALLPGAESART
ncbi:MAG: 3-deoxy-D-manno-octulosonic acid transferase [Proteobacteria bacterium]|mgnify:CR=1 FL=1|nr:3-deoxy-D-manno-octulosonic acid transferase [Pseudomonadota bacterium]